ncbi:hypothetical protein SLS60_002954 [Paraconiothyrium brasiliense]|uniref:Uncharacterized protein n=1 Tax=Paraconiothyrium brasiliense TaxID=300254 RepID=A0ABR3RUC5_9PLEO
MFPFMVPDVPEGIPQLPVTFKKTPKSESVKETRISKQNKVMAKNNLEVPKTSLTSSSTQDLLGQGDANSDTASTQYAVSVASSLDVLAKVQPRSFIDAPDDDSEVCAEVEAHGTTGTNRPPSSTREVVMQVGRHHNRRRSHSKNPVSFMNGEPHQLALQEGTSIGDTRRTAFDLGRVRDRFGQDQNNTTRNHRHHHRRRSQSKNPLSFLSTRETASTTLIPIAETIAEEPTVSVDPSRSMSDDGHSQQDTRHQRRRSNPLSFLKSRKPRSTTVSSIPEETYVFQWGTDALGNATIGLEANVGSVPQEGTKLGVPSKLKKLTKQDKAGDDSPTAEDQRKGGEEAKEKDTKKQMSGMGMLAATMGWGNAWF